MPVTLGVYTFTESNTGAVIPLDTTFVATSVSCEVKRVGDEWDGASDIVAGSIVSATAGTVKVASHTFTQIGYWSYQFYCTNAGGDKLWGEPVVFYVVKNVENLAQKEQITP